VWLKRFKLFSTKDIYQHDTSDLRHPLIVKYEVDDIDTMLDLKMESSERRGSKGGSN
jgi:hypothetical protein